MLSDDWKIVNRVGLLSQKKMKPVDQVKWHWHWYSEISLTHFHRCKAYQQVEVRPAERKRSKPNIVVVVVALRAMATDLGSYPRSLRSWITRRRIPQPRQRPNSKGLPGGSPGRPQEAPGSSPRSLPGREPSVAEHAAVK